MEQVDVCLLQIIGNPLCKKRIFLLQHMNRIFEDQLGRKVAIPENPQRIVSLVPSQTELLYDLGLKEEVVGITKFCIHPNEWFKTKTRVGGTKQVNHQKVKKKESRKILQIKAIFKCLSFINIPPQFVVLQKSKS